MRRLRLDLDWCSLVCFNEHTDVRAVPYFVAIALMSKASLTASEWLSGLLVYNLAFVMPLLMFVAVHRVYRLRFDGLSEWIDGWMRQWGPRVLRYGSIAVWCAASGWCCRDSVGFS